MRQLERRRVAVVEAQPLLAQALAALIAGADDLELAGVWGDYASAVADWADEPPAVAIVDPSLMRPDAVAMLRTSGGAEVPLLLFSRRRDIDYLHLLLAAGARGVVGTDADGPTILDAIRVVAELRRYVPPDSRLVLSDRLLAGTRPAYLQLSAREREILTMATAGDSASRIAARLFLGIATVKTHLRNAYAKLGVHDRASAVREMIRIGVLSADDADAPPPDSREAEAKGSRFSPPSVLR